MCTKCLQLVRAAVFCECDLKAENTVERYGSSGCGLVKGSGRVSCKITVLIDYLIQVKLGLLTMNNGMYKVVKEADGKVKG